MRESDVAIVGGGLAAVAAVLALQTSERSVLVIAPPDRPEEKIGESLSPAANSILRDLGVWEPFLAEAHSPVHATFSAWSTEQLIEQNAIRHPEGPGWSLDRRRFERFLWLQAESSGSKITERVLAKLKNIRPLEKGWQLELSNGDTRHTRFVLDCSGRSSVVARRLAQRQRSSHLVAAFSFLEQVDDGVEPTYAVMIEARAEGWWYSSLTPSKKLVVALFSDADLLPPHLKHDRHVWCALLQATSYTWKRIQTAGFAVGETPALTDSGMLSLDQPIGDHWAAAGDAAVAFDPLSSHGMTTALWSGRKAALAANSALSGDRSPLHRYAETLTQSIRHYEQELSQVYAQQRRFPNAPFWKRRQ